MKTNTCDYKITKEEISALNTKQEQAIVLATSKYNQRGVDLDLAMRVCYSRPPRLDVHSLPFWISDRHEELWQKIKIMSIDEYAQDCGSQISNPRILEYYVPEDEM